MAGLSDILTAIQNGVTALNDLGKQTSGSFNNISGQLALATRVAIQFNIRDMTLASGTQAYSGVGFRPSKMILMSMISTNQSFSIGVDDGTASVASPRCYINFAGIWFTTGGESMYLTADNINIQTAHVFSMDADGYTLTWTKFGVPAAGNAFFSTIAFR